MGNVVDQESGVEGWGERGMVLGRKSRVGVSVLNCSVPAVSNLQDHRLRQLSCSFPFLEGPLLRTSRVYIDVPGARVSFSKVRLVGWIRSWVRVGVVIGGRRTSTSICFLYESSIVGS